MTTPSTPIRPGDVIQSHCSHCNDITQHTFQPGKTPVLLCENYQQHEKAGK